MGTLVLFGALAWALRVVDPEERRVYVGGAPLAALLVALERVRGIPSPGLIVVRAPEAMEHPKRLSRRLRADAVMELGAPDPGTLAARKRRLAGER